MADDKRKKGKRDRSRVAAGEEYEVEYEARKTKTSPSAVRKAIARVGNKRRKVTRALKGRKKK